MAISKYGENVDKILEAQAALTPTEKSVSERITEEARRVEVEQTQAYIHDWVNRRLKTYFPNASLLVSWVESCSWYALSLQFPYADRVHVASITIRDEDITENASSKDDWGYYMNAQSDRLRDAMRITLQGAGHRTINRRDAGDGWTEYGYGPITTTTSAPIKFDASKMNLAATQMNRSMLSMSEAMKRLNMSLDKTVSKVEELEEKEAIESIKRTLRHEES